MIKILFYHANDTIYADSANNIFLGVAALYLKTWIDSNRPDIAKDLHWYLPEQKKLSDSELVELLNKEKPDFFCSSHYIWNHSFLTEQLNRIKSQVSKDICFVAGGPSIDVNIDDNFFQKCQFADYAIYGAGEAAFADIVESKIKNKKLIPFNTSNVAWYDTEKQKTVIADFKYVPQLSISPYTNNVELFSSMVQSLQQKNINIIVPYDLTRGCPYSCTFCDWNSGLTNKTTRRKNSYKDEIDLFQTLKIKNIYLADANVGQYQEDIDMIEYFANKNIHENTDFKIDGNFSKLRKENNLKIYHLLGKANLITEYAGFTISVQDINETVLRNIDRPDVGWPVHLSIIKELKSCYPNFSSKVQLIQGLPGQTVDSWRETLKEICTNNLQLQIFISELLAASPAARDKTYQEKFKFKYATSQRFNGNNFFYATFPESCVSFDKKDFVKMTMLSLIYATLTQFRQQQIVFFDLEKVVDLFLQSNHYKILEENLLNNWVNENKFYFTVDHNGKPIEGVGAMSACYIFDTATTWMHSPQILFLLAKTLDASLIKSFKKLLYNDGDSIKVKNKVYSGFAR